MWELRYQRDGFSVESARKKKRRLPDWYKDQPRPVEGLDFIYEAFRDLQTCRPPDGAIPWTACRLYAHDKGFDPDVSAMLWNVIRKMDMTERQWRYDEAKAEIDS